jgi:hypothetical protein
VLKFNGAWRFRPPPDGQFRNQTIPTEGVEDFYRIINRVATQGNRQDVLEHFKGSFCAAAGTTYVRSSCESWAETDLRKSMDQSAENAPLFIEAFYDACQTITRVNKDYYAPDAQMINAVLQDHNIGYEVKPPFLASRDAEMSPSLCPPGLGDPTNSLRSIILEKESNRTRFLLSLYRTATERGECAIPRSELVLQSGIDPAAARAAEDYLAGEGLIEIRTMGPDGIVEIKHRGVIEIEKRLKNLEVLESDLAKQRVDTVGPSSRSLGARTLSHRLNVFLCHSSDDKPAVRRLYHRLRADGVQPWLDEENLIPGQDWQFQIPIAVRTSDIVIVCLSQYSVSKTGYVQKEIKSALDVADEQPEGKIFIIPVKLEECEIPERLRRWQWVNLFDDKGYERLTLALNSALPSVMIGGE